MAELEGSNWLRQGGDGIEPFGLGLETKLRKQSARPEICYVCATGDVSG